MDCGFIFLSVVRRDTCHSAYRFGSNTFDVFMFFDRTLRVHNRSKIQTLHRITPCYKIVVYYDSRVYTRARVCVYIKLPVLPQTVCTFNKYTNVCAVYTTGVFSDHNKLGLVFTATRLQITLSGSYCRRAKTISRHTSIVFHFTPLYSSASFLKRLAYIAPKSVRERCNTFSRTIITERSNGRHTLQ